MTSNPLSPPHLEPKITNPKVTGKENGLLVIVLMLLLSLIIGLGIGYVLGNISKDEGVNENAVACTMDALVCPDGTGVGRIPPSCDFAPCP